MNRITLFMMTLLFIVCNHVDTLLCAKIVGLVTVRNEAWIIKQCLKGLAQYTDAIAILDDASDDNTVAIIESIAEECGVEKIIKKEFWYRDEPGDRQKILEIGRKIGGTHFIVLDADEMFTANCMTNNFLRKKILDLKPGTALAMNWIQLWRSTQFYRFDTLWTGTYAPIIFCDDGYSNYRSDFIHAPRIPNNCHGTIIKIEGYQYGLLHFQFVNWRNLLVKQAWYRCLEKIRNPQKSSQLINQIYAPSKNETNLGLKPVPAVWFEGYDFFDKSIFTIKEQWREKQILSWFKQYGKDFFAELDIWDIDWPE